MENTGKVLFEDDTPHWYIALGSRWVGPLSAADVYQKVLAQEISWAHFVWRPGQPEWKRICDVPTFQGAVPAVPTSKPTIKTAPAKAPSGPGHPPKPKPPEERSWFLFYNDSQFGPFSTDEISRFLRVGKIHGRVHIWKDGMADWERIESIELFEDDAAEAKRVRAARKEGQEPDGAAASGTKTGTKLEKSKKTQKPQSSGASEQRKAPRRPLVARILMADHQALTVAICRDISVGGMQVLTDRIPGQPGARIRMNVSPAGGRNARGTRLIEPFVAEGVIVRILEDGRGFSFRFEKLPEQSRQVIEDYIKV
jgi:hypothetical protein